MLLILLNYRILKIIQDIIHRLFTAVTNETATITATAADSSGKKASCKVTVKIAGESAENGDNSNDGGNTSTECQHNWVKQKEITGYETVCGCGRTFANDDEWNAHSFEMAMLGETNGHSCSTAPVVTTKYVCSICGAEKE